MSPNLLRRSENAERSARPVTVDYAVYALIVRCVFSVLSALAAYGARPELSDALAKANKSKNWTADQLRHATDSYLRDTLITVLLLAVMVLVMAKFLRDGKNWARWLYVVFAILLTGDVQHLLGFLQYHNVLLRLTSGCTGLAAVAALVFMFMPASNAYFRPAGGSGGLFGSMFGPRTTRPAARPDEPVVPIEAGSVAPSEAEPAVDPTPVVDPTSAGDLTPLVNLTKADRPVSSGQPVGTANRPASGSSAAEPPATRRPPRAKSRRQPTE